MVKTIMKAYVLKVELRVCVHLFNFILGFVVEIEHIMDNLPDDGLKLIRRQRLNSVSLDQHVHNSAETQE